jgi:CHAT domain-containing protein/tetratricopeptide (TPR) repeat protein
MSRLSRLLLIPVAILWPKTLAAADAPLDDAHELLRDGRYATADSVARTALAAAEAQYGPRSLEVAAALDVLVASAVGAGDHAAARPHAERALAIRESALGLDHPEVASSLDILAMVVGHESPAAAISSLERSLSIREQRLAPDDTLLIGTARKLGRVAKELLWAGNPARATSLQLRSLAVLEKARGPAHPDVAEALHRLGLMYDGSSRTDESRAALERSLAIRDNVLPPDHPDRYKIRNDLAGVLSDAGDYAGARRLYDEALAGWRKLGDSHEIIVTTNNLGYLFQRVGDDEAAREALEWVLAEVERREGPDHYNLTFPLRGLAGLLGERMAEYAEAQRLLERAMEIEERVFGPESPRLGGDYHLLGYLMYKMGDSAAAERCLEKARTFGERVWGSDRNGMDHLDLAFIMADESSLFMDRGDYAGARRLLERALEIREKVLGPEHVDVAYTLRDLADLLLASGEDPAEALPLITRSLEIGEAAMGEVSGPVALSLETLADLHMRSGSYDEALAASRRALAIYRQAFGPTHPETGDELVRLGLIHLARGDTAEAVSVSLDGEAIGRDHLGQVMRSLPETRALCYASVRPCGLELALSLASSGGPGARNLRAIWDAQIRTRAIVLDEMSARHRGTLKSGNAAVDSLFDRVRSTRSRLANLALRGPREADPERYRAIVEDARRENEGAESALARQGATFAAKVLSIGLDAVQAALPARGALVAYSRYEEQRPAGAAPAADSWRAPAGAYLAFVARADAPAVDVVPLGNGAAIEAAVAAWRGEVTRTAGGTDDHALETAYRRAGVALRELVWDPVAPHLAGAERVFIVPDGALHLVNFAALPVVAGAGAGYLVDEGPLLHRLSAERDLVPRRETGAGHGLLIVADPDFERANHAATFALAPHGLYRGPRPRCDRFLQTRFEPLPATRSEARAVERWWRRGSSHEEVILLTGSRADEGAVKTATGGKRVVHLATHGFVLGEACSSALDRPVAGGRGIGAAEPVAISAPPAVPAGENPLLLTGLALAGANRREEAAPDEEDGVLTAEELAALDLRGVEWAVLSACGTGMGQLRAGEGVLGLGRAVQVAGARTLVLSLWPVADETAREWMGALYEARFARGLGTAEAVREASRHVLAARRAARSSTHPSTWAAFVAIGDWR